MAERNGAAYPLSIHSRVMCSYLPALERLWELSTSFQPHIATRLAKKRPNQDAARGVRPTKSFEAWATAPSPARADYTFCT